MKDVWQRLAEVADAQHGVVGTWQLAAIGLSRATFARHARERGWIPLRRGAWAFPATRDTYDRALASVDVASHGKAVFTAGSALWAMGVLSRRPDTVHVLEPPEGNLGARGGLCVHRGAPVLGDTTVVSRGFRCADVYRSVTDHARDATIPELERVIAAMDRLRLGTVPQLAAYAESRGAFHGAPRLREALARAGGELPHSEKERLGRRLLREAGLPAPHRRPLTILEDGVMVAEIDVPWPAIRYGVEVDGPHHLLPEIIARDKARDRHLTRLSWVIDRFPTTEVERDPAGFVMQVKAGLTAAAARGVPAWRE